MFITASAVYAQYVVISARLNLFSSRLTSIETSLLSLTATVTKGEEQTMSAISDWAAKESATLATIATGVQALDQKIQDLQNSNGTLSSADQALLDQIAAQSAALATAAATIPAAPVAA
jgi:uncharacterized coiled-coil protein SlyX